MLETWIIVLLTVMVIALIVAIFTNPSRGMKQREAELITQVALLQSELEKKELQLKNYEHENRILFEKVETLETRVRDLELMLYAKSMPTNAPIFDQSLLLVAVDSYFQKQDEIALNKARMPYKRLVNATKKKLESELRSARRQKNLYEYVVFSSHSDENGIILHDGTYLDEYWLNQNLRGVSVVFLAGCKTSYIAESLVNIVDYVISMMENIPTDVSQSFTESFWAEISKGKDVEEAFNEALEIEPSIRPYAELRRSTI